MSDRNLTGRWTGAYRYDGMDLPETSFTAVIEDGGGAFRGQTEEENGPPAQIRGTREGAVVSFSKRYSSNPNGRFADRVVYGGVLSDDGLRVDGSWVIHTDMPLTGDFFMERERSAKEKAKETAKSETILT